MSLRLRTNPSQNKQSTAQPQKNLAADSSHTPTSSNRPPAQRLLRALSGLASDGAELIEKAFSVKSPILAMNSLKTESETSEQKGFIHLLIGLFGMLRNPLAHAPKISWSMPEQDALDVLTLVSLVHRKLDATRVCS